MKTTLQATLIAICALGMATAQAQTTVNSSAEIPSGYSSLNNSLPPDQVLQDLNAKDPSLAAKAYVYNGQVYLPKNDFVTGVAAGSEQAASAAAQGSTAVIIAVGVGVLAIIGAIVAGSSSNGSTGTTSTTSTH